MKFLPYGGHLIEDGDIEAVSSALTNQRITQGPLVDQFEKIITEYVGSLFGVAVNNGTSALTLAYLAIGLGRGDEVITTPLTFAATSNAFLHLGAVPVFVDIDKNTLCINPDLIEELIIDKTKAIAVVDFAGHPSEIDKIRDIANKHNLFLIEDGCHALGSEYNGRKVGGLSDFTVFSFHPVKMITTGEGGIVLTNNKEMAEKMRKLRHHGVVKNPEKGKWFQEVQIPGHNFRITDFQCALGLSQFKKIDNFIKKIRDIADIYNNAFKDIEGIQIPFEADNVKSAWHIYVLRVDWQKFHTTREKVFDFLEQKGIGAQVHYVPLHLHQYFQETFGYRAGDFPETEKYYEKAITLPLFPKMDENDTTRVITAFKQSLSL